MDGRPQFEGRRDPVLKQQSTPAGEQEEMAEEVTVEESQPGCLVKKQCWDDQIHMTSAEAHLHKQTAALWYSPYTRRGVGPRQERLQLSSRTGA